MTTSLTQKLDSLGRVEEFVFENCATISFLFSFSVKCRSPGHDAKELGRVPTDGEQLRCIVANIGGRKEGLKKKGNRRWVYWIIQFGFTLKKYKQTLVFSQRVQSAPICDHLKCAGASYIGVT